MVEEEKNLLGKQVFAILLTQYRKPKISLYEKKNYSYRIIIASHIICCLHYGHL